MAKKKISYAFAKATITKEDNGYILTEYNKDNVESFSLSDILDNYIGIDGVSLSISSEDGVPTIEE